MQVFPVVCYNVRLESIVSGGSSVCFYSFLLLPDFLCGLNSAATSFSLPRVLVPEIVHSEDDPGCGVCRDGVLCCRVYIYIFIYIYVTRSCCFVASRCYFVTCASTIPSIVFFFFFKFFFSRNTCSEENVADDDTRRLLRCRVSPTGGKCSALYVIDGIWTRRREELCKGCRCRVRVCWTLRCARPLCAREPNCVCVRVLCVRACVFLLSPTTIFGAGRRRGFSCYQNASSLPWRLPAPSLEISDDSDPPFAAHCNDLIGRCYDRSARQELLS